jgi:pimeloyl-ACP methyl ester carboxylesterase
MATAPPIPPKKAASVRSWPARIVIFVVVPYVVCLVMLASLQRSLIFFPDRVHSLPATECRIRSGIAEDVVARTEEGLDLHGWWITSSRERPLDARAANEKRRPLILYFCGNAGNRGYRLAEFELLTECGADVLCCDYRGYGENSGTPSEDGLADDARAVWRFATDQRGIPPDRIFLFGESLGGGVAVRLAAEQCAAGSPPGGLILRCTFSSLVDVGAYHFSWIPVRWLLRDRFPSVEQIARVTCPILSLHGSHDSIVPCALGRRLFDAAPPCAADGTAKRFVELPTCDHNNVLEADGVLLRAAVQDFLAR